VTIDLLCHVSTFLFFIYGLLSINQSTYELTLSSDKNEKTDKTCQKSGNEHKPKRPHHIFSPMTGYLKL
jgi:hypothetical protein